MNREIKLEYGFQSVNGIVKKCYHLHDIPNIANLCDVWNVLPFKYKRQFTGLNDIKGNAVLEGDIFREERENDFGDELHYLVVMWIPQRAAFYLVDIVHYEILTNNNCEDEDLFSWLFDDAALYDFATDIKLKSGVIGNIYENPELLNSSL